MGNKDKKFKKYRRKIRIRLADPKDPNSYICEVFDSSYENEEKDSETINLLQKSKEDSSKPKNYFELLMSKDSRKISKVKANAGVEQNCERPTVIKIEEKKRSTKVEIKQKKRETGVTITSKQEADSSEDESLLQIKEKCQLQKSNGEEIIDCEEIAEKTVPEIPEGEEPFLIFEAPKIETNKKTLSILNYFSKTNPKNTGVKRNLKNANEIKNSKISQRKDEIVHYKYGENSNRSEEKLCLNELNKENVKLAPLFYKKEKKVFDSAAQKARLDFLYSSSSVVKKVENKSNDSYVLFPEVVHVQQKNYSPCWSVRTIALPLPKVSLAEYVSKSERKFRYDISNPSLINETVQCSKIQLNKDFINKLKSKYLKLDLELVIDNLKRKRDEYLSFAQELEKSRHLKEKGNDETRFEVLNTLWPEKYKPKSSDILGNQKTLKRLRDWLESWKSFDEALKVLIKSTPKSKAESDDDDAFLDSDDDDYGLKAPGNVCILSGPHASGKTALVFALASELEFKVLELNASSKRTGKKVLSDLLEATQSHKMHHLNVLQNKMPPRGIKKKKKRRAKGTNLEASTKTVLPNNSDCKISLILIEDADVVFEEHDEGFISAITSLAQTSKRPLIFVTRDPNCAYFESFKKDQCLMLEMERPCFYKSCAILDVVSSLEGAHTDEEFLKHLVRRNCFDLRKSLLELQFLTQSRGNCVSLQKQFDLARLWWGLGKFLYKKDTRNYVTSKACKRKRQNDLFDPSDDDEELAAKRPKLNSCAEEDILILTPDTLSGKPNAAIGSYFKILDLVSGVDTLCVSSCSDTIFGFESRLKDGVSLEESLEEVTCKRRNLAEEICEELVKLSTGIFAKDLREKKNEERKFDFLYPSWEEIRWQQSQNKANEELSALVPLQGGGDKRSLRLDYLPIIRNICRVEKSRSEEQPKRKNRFYHYLSNLGIKLQDVYLDANCKIFSR